MEKIKLILGKILEQLWIVFIIYGLHIVVYLTLGKFLMRFLAFNKVSTGYIISLSVLIILSYKSKVNIISKMFISSFSEALFGEETNISNKVEKNIYKTNFRKYFYIYYLFFYISSNIFILNNPNSKILEIFNNFTPYINKENFSKIITTFFFIETYLVTFKSNLFNENKQN